jgi:hypothetical protein
MIVLVDESRAHLQAALSCTMVFGQSMVMLGASTRLIDAAPES